MSKVVKTNIIPIETQFAKIDAAHELDLKAICAFAAVGFFLENDTYWKDEKVLPPASNSIIDERGFVMNSAPWFNWHYSPREIYFDEALDEFSALFETIVKEQIDGRKVILPLSAGIDSRTQATALKRLKADVFSYSYKFKGGYDETKIAKEIARVCNFEFKEYAIPEGYLWDKLDRLATLNKCYSDFTTPRQMMLIDEFKNMGDVFSLGHWGDVLFDNMKVSKTDKNGEIEIILKKIVKRGGMTFASELWRSWDLEGDFEPYLKDRISSLLNKIKIDNTQAKLRAFKSVFWAPRWTSVNLTIFSAQRPITLPYYDDRMCAFICTIPEEFLANRRLQIAYIKTRTPELAKITWQDQRPFNLNNFKRNKLPYNLPYRVMNKVKRMGNDFIGNPYVQRNWELQFNGSQNRKQLEHFLFDNQLDELVPKKLTEKYYDAFTHKDALNNAQAMNILLVLSKFNQNHRDA